MGLHYGSHLFDVRQNPAALPGLLHACYSQRSVMIATNVQTEAAILERVIQPDRPNWSKAAAESILGFQFPAPDIERMNVLAAKARAGAEPDEQSEMNNYMGVGRLLELIQSKARLSLKASRAA